MPLETFLRGNLAEREAARVLRRAGLLIVERNVRVGRDEIDLVGWDGLCVVFVEVRFRERGILAAYESVNKRKRAALMRAARTYRRREGLCGVPWRIDLLLISGHGRDLDVALEMGMPRM